MNPERMPDEPVHGEQSVADRNVERLLTGAYRPEVPDAAFVQRAAAAARAAAAQRRAAPSRPLRRIGRRLIAWAVAASLLVGIGLYVGSTFLGRPRDHQEGVASRGLSQFSRRGLSQLSSDENGTVPLPHATAEESTGALGLTARESEAAPPDEVLAVGESLETGADQRRRVTLEDGSVLYLNQNTAVKLDQQRHVALRRGEVFVEVAPQAEPSPRPSPSGRGDEPRKFIVATPDRQITALGTKFNVRASDAGTSVVVTQGKVQVSGVKLPLLAGQQLAAGAVDGQGTEAAAAAPRASHVLDWTRDLMAAAQSPLVPGSQYAGGALVAVDPRGQESRLSLRKYHVDVYVEDGFARTTIDQTYFNHECSRLEGTFYFPLPPDASLSRLAMYVGGKLMEGGMAERDYARQVFESIVYRQKDPALLEWIDGSTFKMRVFPLEGRQEKRIILSYTQKLSSLYGRSDYRFPGGHNMQMVGRWSAHLRVNDGAKLDWESPSHDWRASQANGDLVLEASAEQTKPDRDVVLTLRDTSAGQEGAGQEGDSPIFVGRKLGQSPSLPTSAQFSSAVHEGSKYLMLRWRPDLPAHGPSAKGRGGASRQRRDWVFLFESSGDRDPLLARVQADVIKTILDNAEHDDTFSIVTAGTQTHLFTDKPLAASPRNIKKAAKFLDQTHLVGALDLERALAVAGPLCKTAKNPHLVHVGSSVPVLGRRDIDLLVKQIPDGTRYVGVGVGKRWSRTFMKTAAARSGGYFTQINPDEQVTWRAFDLLSTLNTPRMLGVCVGGLSQFSQGGLSQFSSDHALHGAQNGTVPFLCHADSLAQGEELCAIARLDAGKALPESVEVTGLIDGKVQSWKIPVARVTQQAEYLPRTWAKLEIDRLVAEGAEKNKSRIIELSKAMYVMSPFTSLLVLENDEMYAQYNVDRGRKDHWAMYACPARIPVVNELLEGRSGRAGALAAAGTAAKPSVEQTMRTLLVRARPPVLAWPGRAQPPVVTLWNGRTPYTVSGGGVFGTGGLIKTGTGMLTLNGSGRYNINTFGGSGTQADFDSLIGLITSTIQPTTWDTWDKTGGSGAISPFSTNLGIVVNPTQAPLFDNGVAFSTDGRQIVGGWLDGTVQFWDYTALFPQGGWQYDVNGDGIPDAHFMLGSDLPVADALRIVRGTYAANFDREQRWIAQVPTFSFVTVTTTVSVPDGGTVLLGGIKQLREGRNEFGVPILNNVSYLNGLFTNVGVGRETQSLMMMVTPRIIIQEEEEEKLGILDDSTVFYPHPQTWSELTLKYQQVAFSGNEAVFADLLSYAPGMNTSAADLCAVVEAEAESSPAVKLGRIDDNARQLIEKARGAGWQTALITAKDGKVCLSVDFDGTGRYRYERTTSAGLREQVVCDGTHLWHLYGELGLGARRTLSRFHRAQLGCLVPWTLPPAEDLARGADLTAIDEHTVAIVPHGAKELRTGRGGLSQFSSDENGTVPFPRSIHLVFDADGRLAERRLVEIPSGNTLLRQTYAADGAVKVLGTVPLFAQRKGDCPPSEDQVLAEWKIALRPCGAPNLQPETKRLVILPLPLRTRDYLQQAGRLPQNGEYETWNEHDALGVVAADLAANPGEAQQIIARRFLARGDRRLGWYALLLASGYVWNIGDEQQFGNNVRVRINPSADHPEEPLAKYAAGYLQSRQNNSAEIGTIGGSGDGLLQQLAALSDLSRLWTSGRFAQLDPAGRQYERVRAMRFMRECKSPQLAWALFAVIRSQANESLTWQILAQAAGRFEKVPALRYAARYEHATALLNHGERQQAEEMFRKLYVETLEAGFLPPIDASFVQALRGGSQQQPWPALMRETATKLIGKGARPAAVRLAWQLHQLGEQAVAEEMLNQALSGAPEKEQLPTTLAAAEFLAQTDRQPRADSLLQPLLDRLTADKVYARWPSLWRLAAAVADRRGMTGRALRCSERALELEYENLPEKVNVQTIREQYGQLMNRYQQVAAAIAGLESQPSAEIVGRVIRAADRWRAIDPDPTAACQAAAKILADLGAADLAWDYLTTPLSARPNEAAPWVSLGETLRQQGHLELADRAYASTFDAEPTNAQVLWDRAQVLLQNGRGDEARKLMRRLADGEWQPAFNGLKAQAKQYLRAY